MSLKRLFEKKYPDLQKRLGTHITSMKAAAAAADDAFESVGEQMRRDEMELQANVRTRRRQNELLRIQALRQKHSIDLHKAMEGQHKAEIYRGMHPKHTDLRLTVRGMQDIHMLNPWDIFPLDHREGIRIQREMIWELLQAAVLDVMDQDDEINNTLEHHTSSSHERTYNAFLERLRRWMMDEAGIPPDEQDRIYQAVEMESGG